MSINKLRSIAQRGSIFGVALAVLASVVLPSTAVFADALNPLTERSLLLTSSAPGFQNSDGSGNTDEFRNAAKDVIPEGEYYAPPGSGPNGQKSGETFTFRVSTDSSTTGTSEPLKAFTLQYCTTAAGKCRSPGNNLGDARSGATTPRETNAAAFPNKRSDFDAVLGGSVENTNFTVKVNDQLTSGWTITTGNFETESHSDRLSGKNNYITLVNTNGIEPKFNDKIEVKFLATDDHYITNPGDKEFFVKINTYDTVDTTKHIKATTEADTENTNIIDGGVTVANVMTDSIHITTKVLETMSFSVGTKNKDTVVLDGPGSGDDGITHGTCDAILQPDGNRLQLGNPDAEYSLETGTAYDVNSYWRLSSNSSGGATVYYSGDTLQNTVGDRIEPIGAAAEESNRGTEQFGLAFVPATEDTLDPALATLIANNPRYKNPTMTADNLTPQPVYANGVGNINATSSARFAFVAESNTLPVVIATNSTNVISCATAKMRYIANIGADTPAGVYTTKINYLAAPQY
jgi:hypothetical protein